MATLLEQAEASVDQYTVIQPPAADASAGPTAGRVAQLAPLPEPAQRGPQPVVAPSNKPTAGQAQLLQDTGGRGTTSRSGYAADKYPHLVAGDEASGKAVPIASDTGAQRGRTPPAQRTGGAHYEAVTAKEAMARAAQRTSGQAPSIAGGLDDAAYDDSRMERLDAPEQVANVAHVIPVPGTAPAGTDIAQVLAKLLAMAAPAPTAEAPPYDPPPQGVPEKPGYLDQRNRVTLQLENGTYAVPAIDVKVSPLGVIILLPNAGDNATFTPNPGTQVTVGWGDKSWPCYYPGTSFDIPELEILALTMIRSDEG